MKGCTPSPSFTRCASVRPIPHPAGSHSGEARHEHPFFGGGGSRLCPCRRHERRATRSKAAEREPRCDAKNICRVYVTLENGDAGKDEIHVHPDPPLMKTGSRDAHVARIILNEGVTFVPTEAIAIQQGDPTQLTDKYRTDDDGALPAATFTPKNFHGRIPVGSTVGPYKYAMTVQRGGASPVTKDPTIVNSG